MITFEDIRNAHQRISPFIKKTPVLTSSSVNSIVKSKIWFKCENFQKVGAFKFRGASNAILQLSEEQKLKGVITHSSGNHAQAVALASKMFGVPATIVMPQNSPQVKLKATRDTYQAKVVVCESTVESRIETCQQIQETEGQTLIHPYDNDHIITGAGTAAYELLSTISDLDIVMAPVGGGGLLSGTSIASKGMNPHIRVIAAEPERADDAFRSYNAGTILKNIHPDTIADGLRTNLCPRTFTIIRKNVERILTVSEPMILKAMRLIWERMKIIIEPSSAVPLAAVMTYPEIFTGKKVGIILSGGNVDLAHFFDILEKKISGE